MSDRNHHEIWIEQCEAARSIKARYGLQSAFDYIVGEKLMNFAEAASHHAQFARSLPQFVSEVRRMFTPEEMHTHLTKLERELNETADVLGNDELLPDDPAAAAERIERFTIVKELLTATELGTS